MFDRVNLWSLGAKTRIPNIRTERRLEGKTKELEGVEKVKGVQSPNGKENINKKLSSR